MAADMPTKTTPNGTDPSRSMLKELLTRMKGKQLVIVMGDERSFKGTVGDFDDEWMLLQDAEEGSAVNSRGWEEVVLNTGNIGKRFTDHGVVTQQEVGELVRMKNVLINLNDVRRVWPWERENIAEPQHVKVETKKTVF